MRAELERRPRSGGSRRNVASRPGAPSGRSPRPSTASSPRWERHRRRHRPTQAIGCTINRTYTPGTAQFLSVDPMLTATGQPYAMEGDNPLNHTDPLGLLLAPAQGGCDSPLPPLPSPQNVSIHHATTTAHQSFANAAQVEVQVPDVTRHEVAQAHATVGADERAVAHLAYGVVSDFRTNVRRDYEQALHLIHAVGASPRTFPRWIESHSRCIAGAAVVGVATVASGGGTALFLEGEGALGAGTANTLAFATGAFLGCTLPPAPAT